MRLRRNSSGKKEAISYADGIRAAKKTLSQLTGPAAIAGGLAVNMHGFIRNTTDVDIVACNLPGLSGGKELSFGGEAYELSIRTGKEITVDVIIRADEYAELYTHAANHACIIEKLPVVTAEHLVLMKYFAGRPKDIADMRWFIQNKPGIVKKAINVLKDIYKGPAGAVVSRTFADDMRTEAALASLEISKYVK